MQKQWPVNSVEGFWRVIKMLRPKEGKREEARHRQKDARMTVFRVIQVIRAVGLHSNWSSPEAVAAALREWARKLGLSRATVAKTAGLSTETIKQIVAGKHCPSAEPALRLAATIDERAPNREPLLLVITLTPRTSPTRAAAAPDAPPTAGPTPPASDPASADAPHPQGAEGGEIGEDPGMEPAEAPDSEFPPTPNITPQQRRAAKRRRWALERRRRGAASRPRATESTRPAQFPPGGRAAVSAPVEVPPESSTRRAPGEPVAGDRRSQKPPTAPPLGTTSARASDGSSQNLPAKSTRRDRLAQDPPAKATRRDRLSQNPPAKSTRLSQVPPAKSTRADLHRIRTSTLVDREEVRQPSHSMHVVKCRFSDGRLTTHQETSMSEVYGFLTRILPGDAIMDAQIQVDGHPFDPIGLIAMQHANQAKAIAAEAQERAAKAEMRAEELKRSRTAGGSILDHLAHGFFEQVEHTQRRLEQEQQQKQKKNKKEKRRHGRS